MTPWLAEACRNGSPPSSACIHEATSSWSGGGVILLGVIVFVIIAWIKKK